MKYFLKLLIFGPTPEQEEKAQQIREMFAHAEKEGYTYRVTKYGGIHREKSR